MSGNYPNSLLTLKKDDAILIWKCLHKTIYFNGIFPKPGGFITAHITHPISK